MYMDCLTKYTKFIPYFIWEDLLTAEQVELLFFFQNIVQHFGIPTPVLYDRDPRFISDFWKSLMKLLGLHTIAISANDSQADGKVECTNHTIGQILHENLFDEDQEHQLDYMSVTKMVLNSSISGSMQK